MYDKQLRADQIKWIERIIELAIEEDLLGGDLSTRAILPRQTEVTAEIKAKADGIISGLEVAARALEIMGGAQFHALVKDGDAIKKGDIIVRFRGNYATLLAAERTMLNFMQRMSGIATSTSHYVAATKGTHTKILDTRKTAPGLRTLDKLAVMHGGGKNHRLGLYDMIMLKDNHIKAVGSITKAVVAARKAAPLSVKIEVETSSIEEVKEALEVSADIIMLDNMDNDAIAAAVKLINRKCATEASGNMTLHRVAEVAALGVDYISVGALTHSVIALDMSMNFIV